MSDETKNRIETALKRRSELVSSKNRIIGRLEEAEKNVEAVKAELVSRKVDPEKLPETLEKLESALQTSLAEFESQLSEAEKSLKPFVDSGGSR